MIKMYIVLGIVILIYIWRIFNGSRNGLIDEVGALADIVIVSAMVVASPGSKRLILVSIVPLNFSTPERL